MARFTASQIAESVGTTGKAFRKWHRNTVTEKGGVIGKQTPGKGKRYDFSAQEAATIKRNYMKAHAVAKSAPAVETAESVVESVEAGE